MWYESNNYVYGRTRNPYSFKRIGTARMVEEEWNTWQWEEEKTTEWKREQQYEKGGGG